jgi:hypothetical protein
VHRAQEIVVETVIISIVEVRAMLPPIPDCAGP